MNRRHFLRTTAGALAAGAVGRSAEPAGAQSALRKAVNLKMVNGKESTEVKFRMILEAGFEGVELNRPDIIPLEEVQAASQSTGLAIANVICSTHWGKPLTHEDPAVREQGLRGLKLALQEAGALSCPTVLLVPGVVNQSVSYADAYTRSQAAIREALPVAAEAKVKIALENVWNYFLLSPLECARYVDEIASPQVGWHFDIGNVVAFGWPEQWVRILGARILTLHIKEYSRKLQETVGARKGFGVELGEGDVGWPRVMAALHEVGYHDWAVLEVPGGDAARLKFLAERSSQLLAN